MAEFSSLYANDYCTGSNIYNGTPTYQDWIPLSKRVSLRAGYKLSDRNWVMCIKFTLPTAAKSITMSFCNSQGNDRTVSANLRYKITEEENVSLRAATSETPGDGSFTVGPNVYARTTITIQRKLPAGTYYMYIWTDDSSKEYNAMATRWYDNSDGYGFYGSYEELDGCVYVGNGIGWDCYEVYVGNGTGWDLYEVYIGNGVGWDAYGG